MSEISELIDKIIEFRDERDWKQFHNSKDLAIAISIESAELLESFLWKDNEGADKDKIKEELADVLMYAFLLANKHNLNIKDIILEKLSRNSSKYPIEKAKGNAKKYNEL
jgi:NTP pyrophosphatase (non-canonical NTP hydrolase)